MLPQVLSLSTKGVVEIWVGGDAQFSPPTRAGGFGTRFGFGLTNVLSDRVAAAEATSALTTAKATPSPTTAAIQLFVVIFPSRSVPARPMERPDDAGPVALSDDINTAPGRASRSCPHPPGSRPRRPPAGCFGWGTIRRYGRGAFQPPGNFCLASSSETAGTMMTSSPLFQFTGVATLCLAVSCIESTTRSTSSKLRPVLIGYVSMSLTFLSGPIT